jgi:hypothetical protein
MYRNDYDALLARVEGLEADKKQLLEDRRRLEAEIARRPAAPPATKSQRLMSPTSLDRTWIECAQDLEKHLKEARKSQREIKLLVMVLAAGMSLLHFLTHL